MSLKCLAIGVGHVEEVDSGGTEFPYLDGAIVAAETIGRWATSSGAKKRDVIVLTDREKPVTDDKLRKAFDRLLPTGKETEHLLIAFAGHGLTGISDDVTYWLLSDSLTNGYHIFVEDLRRELAAYGIHRLTIVSDACRAIANAKDLRNLHARPGIDRRNARPTPGFAVVRYNACEDAEKSFMVKKKGTAEVGKCIFSGVLTEALWGRIPECFDGEVVDNMSMGLGLGPAVAARAKTYDLELSPGGASGYTRIIYYDRDNPPKDPDPELTRWPTAEEPPVATPLVPAPGILPGLDSTGVFGSVLSNATVRRKILGKNFGEAHPDIDTAMAFPGLPEAAEPMIADLAWSRWQLGHTGLVRTQRKDLRKSIADNLKAIEALAAGQARSLAAEHIANLVRRLETAAIATQADLLVLGSVKQVWAPTPTVRINRNEDGRVDLVVASDAFGQQLLIEFDDGLFAPFVPYPGRVGMMVCDSVGVQALSYRSLDTDKNQIDTAKTSQIVAELRTGKVTAQMLDRQAMELREFKHVDPVFGAIAAHCYDVIGDLDSTRRMAFYYARNAQPAPYDVVFMAMLENNGKIATVPAVGLDARRKDSGLPEWLFEATKETPVVIGGRCPWLRQGWDFFSAPEDVERPLVGNLGALRDHLKPAPFTTLDATGGQALVQTWGLQPCL